MVAIASNATELAPAISNSLSPAPERQHPPPPLGCRPRDATILTATGPSSTSHNSDPPVAHTPLPRPLVATLISPSHPQLPSPCPKRDKPPFPVPGSPPKLVLHMISHAPVTTPIHQSPKPSSPSSGRRIHLPLPYPTPFPLLRLKVAERSTPQDEPVAHLLSLHPPVAQSLAVELPPGDLSDHRSVLRFRLT